MNNQLKDTNLELRLNPSKNVLDQELEEKISRLKQSGNWKRYNDWNYLKKRVWTDTEINYLREKWGIMNIENIAKNLTRTESAVVWKAKSLKLGGIIESSGYISVYQLALQFKTEYLYQCTVKKWVKHGFKYKLKKINKRSIRVVEIDYFWEWAEKNQDILNFADLEKNALGKEPQWVKAKRLADFRRL